MSRVITQVSPKTVLRSAMKKENKRFWVSGIRIEKYAGDEKQHVDVDYIEPQEVSIEIGDRRYWHGDDSITRLTLIMKDGTKLSRWEANSKGIKFFKTRDDAEKYFLYVSDDIIKKMNDILNIHDDLYKKISIDYPSFIESVL